MAIVNKHRFKDIKRRNAIFLQNDFNYQRLIKNI